MLGAGVLAWQHARLLHADFWPLLFLVPLVAPLPGLARGRRYTYAWSTLVMIGYVALGITETLADPSARTAPAFILFTAFVLFVVLIGYLRVTRSAPRR
jgi:uncharacterized membrane protein